MKTIFEICKDVADLCATARPKVIEGEWESIVNNTLASAERYKKFGVTFTDEMLTLGMVWRWKKRHEEPYNEELNELCALIGED